MSSFQYERFPPSDTFPDDDDTADQLDGDQDEYDSQPGERRQRPKIRRCRLTAHQLQTLNHFYEQGSQPSMETRISLGQQLGMETKQVSAWFQNKRQKLKNAPATSFPSSSLPPSSHPSEYDSYSHHHHQPLYHSRDLPPLDYNRYQQPYSSYARPQHSPPPSNFTEPFTRQSRDMYQYHQHQHQHPSYDMRPSTTMTNYQHPSSTAVDAAVYSSAPAGSGGLHERVNARSYTPTTQYSRSRSSSADSRYTGTTEFLPQATHSSSKGYQYQPNHLHQQHQDTAARSHHQDIYHQTSKSTKHEPYDEAHHRAMLRVPSPPPEAVNHPSPSMRKGDLPTNRRTSTRARSARLAASPIVSNRHPSVTGSPASNAGGNEVQPKRLTRSRMSSTQRNYLQTIYDVNPEPTMAERQIIADKLGVQIGKITNWFRNLRQSVRRGKLANSKTGRGATADSRDDEHDELDHDQDEVQEQEVDHHAYMHTPAKEKKMELYEEEYHSDVDSHTHVSRSPAPPALAPAANIVPGKGAYSTQSLMAASEYASHSIPEIYADAPSDDDDDEEEDAHEALTPYHSPESKLAHSFGPGGSTLNVSSTTPEGLFASPTPSSRGGISLPSISIALAQTSAEKRELQPPQKYNSNVEDALLLLHFRENCDVKDIHHGVVVSGGRASSPLY